MILFLTGNTFRDRTGCEDKSEMIPDNHLIDEMQKVFPAPCRALYFSDGPDDFEFNDFIANDTRDGFEYSGFQFESFICVDDRNASQAKELIRQANFIILGGGHTPSQNRFFKGMGLADLLKDYDGVIWAISAGSMNCAETVYAAPEEDGSYILVKDGIEELRGEAYIVHDGTIKLFTANGDSVLL